MKRLITLFLCGCVIPTYAAAKKRYPDNVVFSCKTTNNKQILITKNGNNFTYWFGKNNIPEMTVTRSREQLLAEQKRAVFIYGWMYDLNIRSFFRNGNYVYSVYENHNPSIYLSLPDDVKGDEYTDYTGSGVEVFEIINDIKDSNNRENFKWRSVDILCKGRPIISKWDNGFPES